MKKVIVDDSKCIRCGACMSIASDVFKYGPEGESVPKVDTVSDDNMDAIAAMEGCPTGAIILKDAEETGCDCQADSCDCGDDCECEDCDCEGCDCEHCECDNCECGHEE